MRDDRVLSNPFNMQMEWRMALGSPWRKKGSGAERREGEWRQTGRVLRFMRA